jgi:phage terminase small subunit
MPVLPNPRHESFAQALAKGKSAAEAYVAAGYKDNRSAASRLSTNVNVAARVAVLSERIAEKAEWTAADRLRMLADIAESTVKKDPRVAVSAIAEANKMQGSHAPTKTELTGPDGAPIQTETRTWREKLRGE